MCAAGTASPAASTLTAHAARQLDGVRRHRQQRRRRDLGRRCERCVDACCARALILDDSAAAGQPGRQRLACGKDVLASGQVRDQACEAGV